MRDRCRESSIPERRWRNVSGCRRVGADVAWRRMNQERARGVMRILAEIEEGVGSLPEYGERNDGEGPVSAISRRY